MTSCHALDRLVTPFVDGECTPEEQAAVAAHLQDCPACRTRVEAESTARHVLQAHAAVARTMGVAPTWRPRVWWLGRPGPRPHPAAMLVLALAAGGLLAVWLRPVQVSATGIIGDSFCGHSHRFSSYFNVDDRTCTLGCVSKGASFVLVTDGQVYQIRDQRRPELAALANRRVRVTGAVSGESIDIASIAAADR